MSFTARARFSSSKSDNRLLSTNSFTPYDFTRQPRKSWFVADGSGADSTTASADASTSISGSAPIVPVHTQALTLDEQPMADMTSSGVRTGSALGSRLERADTGTGSEVGVTPAGGQGQSFEMGERRTTGTTAGQSSATAGEPGQAS